MGARSRHSEGMASGLRVLAADEDERALGRTVALLRELGHDVVGRAVTVGGVAEQVAGEEGIDLATVVVQESDEHALDLIEEIIEVAGRPVVVLVDAPTDGFIAQAAERGIFAQARPGDASALQAAIQVAIRRFTEADDLARQVGQLETALERRSVIERAKGILMERHGVDERAAFCLLRDEARRRSLAVVELARAVSDGHALLPRRAD